MLREYKCSKCREWASEKYWSASIISTTMMRCPNCLWPQFTEYLRSRGENMDHERIVQLNMELQEVLIAADHLENTRVAMIRMAEKEKLKESK